MSLPPLTYEHAATRGSFAQILTHVLGRRRFAVTGRFGLRVAPGSIATPMFGDDEVLRLGATSLLREQRPGGRLETTVMPLEGATVATLASFVDADLDVSFSVGHDTITLDRDTPLHVDRTAASTLVRWLALASEVLDHVLAEHPDAGATAVQLWPEHFDLAVDVVAGAGRTNLGASVGDAFCDEPYLYVGPWDARRPGDAAFWNAPFGAVLRYGEVAGAAEPAERVHAFWSRGLAMLDA